MFKARRRMAAMTLGIVATITASAAIAAEQAIGWRTDGTGSYTGLKKTPNEWDAAKRTNIRWATDLPARGNATPVVAGDKVFVCAENAELICLSLKDGSVLWTRSHDPAPPDEAMQAKYKAAEERNKALDAQVKPLIDERTSLAKALREDRGNETLKQKIAEVNAKIDKIGANREPTGPPGGKAPTHETNGFSSATPVVADGKVFVTFGIGVAAAYDMEGKQLWKRTTELPTDQWGTCASPVIADNKLIFLVNKLYAVDLATGNDVWVNKEVPPRWGTPIPTRLGDTTVLVTASGHVVRASDGKILANNLGVLEYNSPLVVGDTVYLMQTDARAWKLSPPEGDVVVAKELWRAKITSGRHYSSPILHDGVVYAINQNNMLTALDAGTGQLIYSKNVERLMAGTVYPSIALAGGKIYLSNDNGRTLVIRAGRSYEELSLNMLETFRSTPVFVGDVMLVRGMKKLWCVTAP